MKKQLLLSALIFTAIFSADAQLSCPKWGPYVKTAGFKKSSDELMMADVMIPSDGLAPFTYACSVQFDIGKSGGYCGIQLAGPTDNRIPNNIFSIWDFPNKIQISSSYKAPITFIGGFGGEGTGLHSHADFGWKPDHWYTNIVRRWAVNDSTTEVGYWVYDHTAKTYTHYVTFTVPEKNAMLHGEIGSFLENFADEQKHTRTAVYKSYYVLSDQNQWLHPDSLTASAGEGSWKAERYGDDGVKATSCGTMPWQKKTLYAVKQKDKPELIAADVYDLAAFYDHSQKKIFVDWSIQQTATPQLSYEVKIFTDSTYTGKPLASLKATNPDANYISIDAKELNLQSQDYYVTLQITDIFGQLSPVKKFVMEQKKP